MKKLFTESTTSQSFEKLEEALRERETSSRSLPKVKLSTVRRVAKISEERKLRKFLSKSVFYDYSVLLGAAWNHLVISGEVSFDDVAGNVLSASRVLEAEVLPVEVLDRASQHPNLLVRGALADRHDLSPLAQQRLCKSTELKMVRGHMARNISVQDVNALSELVKSEALQIVLIERPVSLPRAVQVMLSEVGSLEARHLLVKRKTFDEDIRVATALTL